MPVQISVVIPTYKRPGLLIKCLEALYRQRLSLQLFEVIVVTDGPDEATVQCINEFEGQCKNISVRCISHLQKRGPAAARNAGWKAAQGKLIVFTDDDCLPDKNWLVAYQEVYSAGAKKEIAFTGKTSVPHREIPTDFEKNTAGLQSAEFITANCACSKAALQKVAGFNEQFTMAWREDSDLQFRLIEAGIPIIKVHTAMVVHPVRKAPWAISIKEQKKSLFNALLYKNHPSLYEENIGVKPIWNYYAMVLLAIAGFLFLVMKLSLPAFLCVIGWLLLVLQFTMKRLQGTSKSINHVLEMLYTSAVIPFLSVYWTLYGAVRYKKLLL